MRVAIDFRFLSAGSNTIRRGFGRYTQQQLREVLRINASDSFLLLYNERCNLSAILPEILTAPNIELTPLPRVWDPAMNLDSRHPAALATFEQFLDSHGVDLFHSTTQFLMNDLLVTQLAAVPSIVTHYDLIPLVYGGRYFSPESPNAERMYRRAMRLLEKSDRLIAISNFVKQEAQRFLGRAGSSVDVACPIADPVFRPMAPSESESVLGALRQRHGFGEHFFLAVTAYHHSKNFELLASAYGSLPSAVRARVPLVMASYTVPEELAIAKDRCVEAGILDSVIFTGEVTDEELAALYSTTSALVHPSRYEGFGLPVLEGMRCGATVITTKATSLPEVCGDAGILVDEDDPAALASQLLAVTEGRLPPDVTRERAIEQSLRFSGGKLGEATLAAYEKAARPRSRSRRRRIAMWSPLPPQRSGISHYATDLVTALESDYEFELFIDDGVDPSVEVSRRWPVHHHSLFQPVHLRHPFDLSLYQLGSWPVHEYIGEAALRWPGVVTLHDLNWGGMLADLLARRGRGDRIEAEILAHEGRDALAEFRRLPARSVHPAARARFFETRHLLGRFFDASLATITHMPAIAHALARRYRVRNLHAFPLAGPPPGWIAAGESDAVRRERSGYGREDVVIAAFGFGGYGKLLDVLLDAFASVARSDSRARLAYVGEFVDTSLLHALLRKVEALGIGQRVRFHGYVDAVTFDRLLLSSEIVVNLRTRAQQQMSGTLVRALAAGRPVIVSDIEEWASVPDDCCRRLPPDADAAALAREIGALLADPDERRRLGKAAQVHYSETGTVPMLADHYRRIIEETIGRSH